MSPWLVVAGGFAASLVLSVVLEHRAKIVAARLSTPRTSERDAGFNEGLERAAEIVDGQAFSFRAERMAAVNAIRGARRS